MQNLSRNTKIEQAKVCIEMVWENTKHWNTQNTTSKFMVSISLKSEQCYNIKGMSVFSLPWSHELFWAS